MNEVLVPVVAVLIAAAVLGKPLRGRLGCEKVGEVEGFNAKFDPAARKRRSGRSPMGEPGVALMTIVTGLVGLALMFWQARGRDEAGIRVLADVGEAGALGVELLCDRRGARYVGVSFLVPTFPGRARIRCVLTPAQARLLSEMLRVATSPGANVAQARARRRARLKGAS